MTEPGRFLLVELAGDLAAAKTTYRGVWAGVRILPGVVAITDIAYVGQETLDVLLATWPIEPDEPPQPETDYQMDLIA